MRAGLALALVLGCASPSESRCPSGAEADEAHATRIRSTLATTDRGRALIDTASARVRAICFVPARTPSVVDDAHDVLLASDLDDGEAAARLGHLLVHLRDGLPDEGLEGPDCERAVERAIRREAVAYVEEVLLQDALRVAPRTLAFEFSADVLAAPDEARDDLVLAYLHAHPHGAPGIDGLEAGYRARCERSRER